MSASTYVPLSLPAPVSFPCCQSDSLHFLFGRQLFKHSFLHHYLSLKALLQNDLINCLVLWRTVSEREEPPKPNPTLPHVAPVNSDPTKDLCLEIDDVCCFNSRILPSRLRRFGFTFQPTPCYYLSVSECQALIAGSADFGSCLCVMLIN